MYPYIFKEIAFNLVSHETSHGFMITSTPTKSTAHAMLLCLSLIFIAATHISSCYCQYDYNIYRKSYRRYVT
jgi:hypothetical protein